MNGLPIYRSLPASQAIAFLESDELLDEVERMMNEARRKGVNGVPFVVIDGKWAVSGGQTAEVYAQVCNAAYAPSCSNLFTSSRSSKS